MISYSILTFHTISEVLRFEKLMKQNQIEIKLMPVPRQYSSSCGICAKVLSSDIETIKEKCNAEGVELDQVYNQ